MFKKKLIGIKLKLISLLQWFNFVKDNYEKKPPIFTKKDSEGLKIHLGPGNVNLQGWINIDGLRMPHIHNIDKDFDLKEFNDNSISEIYLSHVLEHFSFQDSKSFLQKLKSKLKSNGTLRISVPDIDKILNAYNSTNNLKLLKNAIMGGQNTDLDFHKSIYNKIELENLLKEVGFKNISVWSTKDEFGKSIGDWSDFEHKINGQKFNLNLNLKASL
tara:strand:+ start:343 stop:990 length:648 start_codon:yes stop_codon:yes gene_type:complete